MIQIIWKKCLQIQTKNTKSQRISKVKLKKQVLLLVICMRCCMLQYAEREGKMHCHTAIKTRLCETEIEKEYYSSMGSVPSKGFSLKSGKKKNAHSEKKAQTRGHTHAFLNAPECTLFSFKFCGKQRVWEQDLLFLSPEIHLPQQLAKKIYLNEIYPCHRSSWRYIAPHLKQAAWYQNPRTTEVLFVSVRACAHVCSQD